MKNKIYFSLFAFFIASFGMAAGCGDDDTAKSGNSVSPVVGTLLKPDDGRRVDLSVTRNLTFEWAQAEPAAEVTYQLLFDRKEGDFRSPLKTMASDDGGTAAVATLSKETLDEIARTSGAAEGETAALVWTVRTTPKKGGDATLSTQTRSLSLTRESAAVPEDGFCIAGEGAEEGQPLKSVGAEGAGSFEIYTRIEKGKPYYFCRTLNGLRKMYAIAADAETVEEMSGSDARGGEVAETGCYRIRIDLAAMKASVERIDGVVIRTSWEGKSSDFVYKAGGVWECRDYTVPVFVSPYGIEERYKIIFTVDGEEEHWGQLAEPFFPDRPTLEEPAGYRDMAPTEADQWVPDQFKFPGELLDRDDPERYVTDVVLSMTAEGNYTHDFTNIRENGEHVVGFTNPVFTDFSLPDPDVIRADDGCFYLYATEHSTSDPMMKNSPVMRSKDLVHWERVGSLFTDDTHPQITDEEGAGIWAPTVNRIGDNYVIYYSQPGRNYKHAIGVATSKNPAGPFEDRGKLIDSNEQGVDISIDAFLYQEEDGRNYLFWGSFRNISVIELTADGLAIKEGAVRKEVAGGQYEASYVVKKFGYYYLIVSTGDYSKNGTYSLVAGRSKNLLGPYVDKAGEDMMAVKHEMMLKGNPDNFFSSPGHCSRIITDDAGQEWILYHAYRHDMDYRCLMLDRVTWVDEWPVVNSGVPSCNSYVAPVFDD